MWLHFPFVLRRAHPCSHLASEEWTGRRQPQKNPPRLKTCRHSPWGTTPPRAYKEHRLTGNRSFKQEEKSVEWTKERPTFLQATCIPRHKGSRFSRSCFQGQNKSRLPKNLFPPWGTTVSRDRRKAFKVLPFRRFSFWSSRMADWPDVL